MSVIVELCVLMGASWCGAAEADALISQPDFVTYIPSDPNGMDGTNEHFLVVPTPKRTFLAIWTRASQENNPDQHLVLSRSEDQGKTWSPPTVIAGGSADSNGRMASWGFSFVVPHSGRVYLFWNQNVGIEDVREDTTGELAYRWSDDDGRTWSRPRSLPIRKSAISHPDPKVPESWVTFQCPIITRRGDVMVGFTRWASKRVQAEGGLFERDSEIWFLRFDNILTIDDPAELKVTTLPDGDRGLRVPSPDDPKMSVAQEPTFQDLSDGRMICTMRNLTGSIQYALSADGGHTWDQPRPLRYAPGGPKMLQPLAPCPLYKLADGRFVQIFHNNDGTAHGGKGVTDSKVVRRPVFVAIGREIRHADQPIMFGNPRLLADNNGVPWGPKNDKQIGTYPSLFEFEGKVYFWYPDRKHYLLGKLLTPELLDDAGLPR